MMTLNQALKALESRVSYCEEEKSAIHRAFWEPSTSRSALSSHFEKSGLKVSEKNRLKLLSALFQNFNRGQLFAF